MNNDYLSKFYELGYTHVELEALLKKISEGELLTKDEHSRLMAAISLIDGLTTFNGTYESLPDKPDIVDTVRQSNEFVTYLAFNSKAYVMQVELENALKQLVMDMKLEIEDTKADIEHWHDDRYSLLNHDHNGVYTTPADVKAAIRDVISNEDLDINAKGGDCAYVGSDMPDNNDVIWFCDESETVESEFTYSNPLINELFSCIRSLQEQVKKLQEDVEIIKLNGGGITPGEPDGPGSNPDEPEIMDLFLMLEDGGLFELEDGGYLILEEVAEVVKDSLLILEDGYNFLLEDGGYILLEESIAEVQENLMLLESGAQILLENGYKILLENQGGLYNGRK